MEGKESASKRVLYSETTAGKKSGKKKESTTKRVLHPKLQRAPMLGLDSIYGKTNYKMVSLEKTLTRKMSP